MRRPKQVWGAIITRRGGLIWHEPKLFVASEFEQLDGKMFVEPNSGEQICNIGLDKDSTDCITFSSIHKEDVENWISGARSIVSMMPDFSKDTF